MRNDDRHEFLLSVVTEIDAKQTGYYLQLNFMLRWVKSNDVGTVDLVDIRSFRYDTPKPRENKDVLINILITVFWLIATCGFQAPDLWRNIDRETAKDGASSDL